MKNMTKNKSKLCTLIALVIIIGFLAFLQSDTAEYNYQISIPKRSAIYAAVTVSMNLLTGFTGLFSPGQTGFMAVGAYVVTILTIPVGSRTGVYYVSGMSSVIASIQLPIPAALPLGRLAAAAMTTLIGIPVLRLKNDYLVIAALSFSETIRAFIVAPVSDAITSGPYSLKNIPGFPSTFAAFGLAVLCIALIMLLINSSYDRAFKSIREDEVIVQSMGINLFRYKELSFVISSFFIGVGGGMLAVFMRSIDFKTFQMALTCGILLIVVLGGIGSVTGSVAGAFLVTAGKELSRSSDDPLAIAGVSVPLLRSGFHMVIFSILLMTVVLFYSCGIIGNHEFSWGGLFQLIRGTPGKFKRDRKKPSSTKKGGIH